MIYIERYLDLKTQEKKCKKKLRRQKNCWEAAGGINDDEKKNDIKEELTLVRAEKERKGLHEETIIVSNEVDGN